MVKRGVYMKLISFTAIKCKILLKKNILNFLLLFFCPSNKLMIVVSQNLDKSIVQYQKQLLAKINNSDENNSKYFKNIAA